MYINQPYIGLGIKVSSWETRGKLYMDRNIVLGCSTHLLVHACIWFYLTGPV